MAKKFDFLSPGINIREIDQSILPPERDAEGPIIVGRARKGPGLKPVKIRNLDDFISVFGAPVAGGGEGGDIWRSGNTVGPTFGVYAAQAWLASGESPITYVRLTGDQHPSANAAGYAGWKLNGSASSNASSNATAYGLFLADSSDLSSTLTWREVEATTTPSDAYVFNVTDSAGSAVAFEFDSNSSVTETTSTRQVVIDGTATTMSNLNDKIMEAVELGYLSNILTRYFPGESKLQICNTSTTGAGTIGETGSGLGNVDIDAVSLTAASEAVGEGALAAILYANDGYLALNGEQYGQASDNTTTVTNVGRLFRSNGNNKQFKLKVYNASGTETDSINFNFDRNSSNYIRNVLNTNPQAVNSTITPSDDLKTYWLGETFNRHLETYVTGTVKAYQAAVLLPLQSGSTQAGNWGYRATGSAPAKSGYVFSQRSTGQQSLFRLCSLHDGEDFQKNHMIAIEDIREPANPISNPYGTFTVCVKDMAGNSVEKFSGVDLNPNSANYIARRIGDQYMSWDNSKRRYRTYGDFANASDQIRVEMASGVANGGGGGLLPAGFRGPVRHKSFGANSGSIEPKSIATDGSIAGKMSTSYLLAGELDGDSGVVGGVTGSNHFIVADKTKTFAVKYHFPSIPLRQSGSDGGAVDPYRVYWGIRPKLSNTSTQNDPDYVDYLRAMPAGVNSHVPNVDAFEYSFHFSLDDLVINTSTNIVQYRSGSWSETGNDASVSYTSPANSTTNHNGTFGAMLDLGVRQFLMPMWGGRDGLDITEAEPFRNTKIGSTLDELNNYTHYSLYKAIDAVRDSEVVPANLLLAPGINQPIITDKLISTAESRRDVLAIIDLEHDYTQSAESTANSTSRLGSVTSAISSIKSRNLNSSYACTFYPAVQITDNINAGSPRVWIPSSVAALGGFASSQAKSEVWFAPAGFNRGGLGNLGGRRGPRVIQARQRLDSRERDDLYQVNINPIATFPAEGVVVFGQKTLQADASALDRINVRRLLLFLKARVSDVARNLLFDPNLPTTWNRFKSQVNPILSNVKARFGLADYKLILDETTTTPDLIDRNIMYAKIFIKPARAIEYIVVDFVITKSGADFT